MSNPARKITAESVDKRADIITHNFFQQRNYMEEKFGKIDGRFDEVERLLDSFMKETNERFNIIENKLDTILDAISKTIKK